MVDTYWQTETGSITATSVPGVHAMKPSSCGKPFFGMDFILVDPVTGKEVHNEGNNDAEGVLCIKSIWPSVARTLLGDHDRFVGSLVFSSSVGQVTTIVDSLRPTLDNMPVTTSPEMLAAETAMASISSLVESMMSSIPPVLASIELLSTISVQ